MDKKSLILQGLVFAVITALINCGIFVTFPQMTAYAAPKDDMNKIQQQLNRIETKVDTLILDYGLKRK